VLGTYPSAGEIPGKPISVPLGKQDSFLSTTTAAQPVMQFFKIHAAVSVAKAEADRARSDAQRAQNEVSLNVKKLYFGLLSAEKRKQAEELRMEAGEARLKEASTGVEAGAVLQLKALEARAKVAEARYSLGSLQDALADMQTELNDLLGLPLSSQLAFVAPEEDSLADHLTNIASQELTNNPEVSSARATLQKAHAGLSAAHAEFIPQVGIFAEHVYQNGVPLLPESSGVFGLRMDWTLSEFGSRAGLVRERRAQLTEAEVDLQRTENHVRIDTEKELRRLNRSETGLEAARQNLAARAEMRRITENQMRAATTTSAAFKEAEAQLAEAQAQFFQAEADRAIAKAELNRTLGVD